MDINCAPLVADLFLFCYEDDHLNIATTYFDGIVNQIYPSELQLNKANSSYTEVPFLDLHLTFSDGFAFF